MNERVTKIVIDTLGKEGVIASRALGYRALSDEELEKFAELIVRECCDMVNKHLQRNNPNDGLLVLDIKEKFGIES